MKKLFGVFVVAAFGAAAGIGITQMFDKDEYVNIQQPPALQLAHYPTSTGATVVENPDFVGASTLATPAVVHIKSYYEATKTPDPFGGLFGNPQPHRRGQASGSGVIVSVDGYIATNNHVIKKADKVEVTLNDKRTYRAEVIGTDPTTDLALLKIDEQALPSLGFGNSENVQVGEWVLAVGNPFNLTSTVTAGIVSAKGRNLNLLSEEYSIESFIQTDAAVNPGNSGGALINTKGELIGINTAIASETGSYAGYSFAVPVNIVKKVMKDLREFGSVQRGIIGVQINNIDANLKEKKELGTLNGAYIQGIFEGSAADKAGIKVGDVITRVNESSVGSAAELQEAIGTYRPGDKVTITLMRGQKLINMPVTLQNKEGNTQLAIKRDSNPKSQEVFSLGADFEKLTHTEKAEMEIENGVRVKRLKDGKLMDEGIEEGFVITRVNKQFVDSPEEIDEILKNTEGTVLIEGVNPNGRRQFFAFQMD